MPPTPATIPTWTGLSGVAGDFDLILCDVWGVLHDGTRGHGAAAEALIAFRALAGPRPRPRPRRPRPLRDL